MPKEVYFSIIMPTLNSEKTIEKALSSVRNQDFDQDKVEILVLDGGSRDKTLEIAQKFGVRVIFNEKVQQEYAKHLGILNSEGKVCLFLDSDEILEDKDSLKKRQRIYEEFKDIKVILFGGYKKPKGASSINDYINYFSDPFSYFVSGISMDSSVITSSWKRRFPKFKDVKDAVIFNVGDEELPPIDMCAGNCFLKDYYLDLVGKEIKNPMIVPEIFYKIVRSTGCFAMLKNSPTVHYSADSVKKFFKKLDWRVKVNIHFKNIPGTGYSNRESLQPKRASIKKYFFIPYALTVVVPFLKSFYIFLKYKKPIFFIHPILSFYVTVLIIYYYVLLVLGIKPVLKTYGKGDKVLRL